MRYEEICLEGRCLQGNDMELAIQRERERELARQAEEGFMLLLLSTAGHQGKAVISLL